MAAQVKNSLSDAVKWLTDKCGGMFTSVRDFFKMVWDFIFGTKPVSEKTVTMRISGKEYVVDESDANKADAFMRYVNAQRGVTPDFDWRAINLPPTLADALDYRGQQLSPGLATDIENFAVTWKPHPKNRGQGFVDGTAETVHGWMRALAALMGIDADTGMIQQAIAIVRVYAACTVGWRLTASVMQMIQVCISSLCVACFECDPFSTQATNMLSLAQTMGEKMNQHLMVEEIGKRIQTDAGLRTQVIELYEDVMLFSNALSVVPGLAGGPSAGLSSIMRRYYEECYSVAKRARSVASTRTTPTATVMSGPSGTGKSSASAYAMRVLARMKFKKEFDANMVASYPSDPSFWEGYAGQHFIVVDEMLTMKDDEKRVKFVSDWLSMVNNQPFAVPMAFSLKGANMFLSKQIIATTNVESFGNGDLLKLSDPKAFGNRIDMWLHFGEVVKPGDNVATGSRKVALIAGEAMGLLADMFPQCVVTGEHEKAVGLKDVLTGHNFHMVMTIDQVVAAMSIIEVYKERCANTHLPTDHTVVDATAAVNDQIVQAMASLERAMAVGTVPVPAKVRALPAAMAKDRDDVAAAVHAVANEPRVQAALRNKQAAATLTGSALLYAGASTIGAVHATLMHPEVAEAAGEAVTAVTDALIAAGRTVRGTGEAFTTVRDFNLDAMMAKYSVTPTTWYERAYAKVASVQARTWMKLSVGLFGTAAALYGGYVLYKRFMVIPEEAVEGEAQDKTYDKQVKSRKHQGRGQAADLELPDKALAQVRDVMLQSYCRVGIAPLGEDGDRHVTNGIFVAPYVVMIVGHSLLGYTEKGRISVETFRSLTHEDANPHEWLADWLEPDDIYRHPTEDVALILLPKSMCPTRAITKQLICAKDAVQWERKSVVLTRVFRVKQSLDVDWAPGYVERKTNQVEYDFEHEGLHATMSPEETLLYRCKTIAGDCGNLLMVSDRSMPRKVAGFHVGGNGVQGFAVALTQERVQEWLSHLAHGDVPNPPLLDTIPDVKTKGVAQLNPGGFNHCELEGVATVPEEMQHSFPQTSRIRRSPYYGTFGPATYAPAQLRPKDGKVPYVNGVKKMRSRATPAVTHVPFADKVTEYFLFHYPPTNEPVIFTTEQSVLGVSEYDVPGINMQTSSGYPWSFGGASRKTRHVTVDAKRTTFVLEQQLAEAVMQRELLAHEGERTLTLFADCLKDEIRPIEKVEAGKTRVFSACPLDFLIVFRKYMLHFITVVQRKATMGPIKVGLNVHGLDWAVQRQQLTGMTLSEGDYSDYDGTIHIVLCMLALVLLNMWYRGVGAVERNVLFWEMIHTFHIVLNIVYQTFGSHPSGDPATSIWNSIINLIIIVSCVWVLATKYSIELSVTQVLLFLYGDDNLNGVPVPTFPWSEMPELVLQYYGMKLTSASKLAEFGATTMAEATFLSRSFVPYKGIVNAPMKQRRVFEIINWFRDEETSTLDAVVDAFCLEASHFGEELYEQWTSVLRAHPVTALEAVVVPTYRQVVAKRFDTTRLLQ
jgi:hypothetical protein